METENKLAPDVKYLVEALLRGAGERRLRLARGCGSAFDREAQLAIDEAKAAVGGDIADPNVRRALGERVLFSLSERIPYAKMGECFCCENKFYGYRRDFCLAVAKRLRFM